MKTILIVDDDASIVKSWERILHSDGYRVVAASDGGDGFAAAKSERPSLIITDRSMPTMGGVELCRRLKLETELARIPVILTSADSPSDDRRVMWGYLSTQTGVNGCSFGRSAAPSSAIDQYASR